MYIHLGSDTVVNSKDIIAIMDMDTATVSKNSRDFLRKGQYKGNVINVEEEQIPKSFVVCKKDKDFVIYITNISSKTLEGRVKKIREAE